MESLHRGILAVGTLSPKNTSLTPPPPPPPNPWIVSSLPHDKSLSVLQNCEVFTMGVQPCLPKSASRLFSLLECDRADSLTCTQTHAHDCTCVSMHRNGSHTHVIRHVWNFYSVGHVSICGIAQTCSLSSKHPCFEIILGKALSLLWFSPSPLLWISVPVHTQGPSSQERPGHGEQHHEDRRLWPGQRRPQHRLLQKDDKCECRGTVTFLRAAVWDYPSPSFFFIFLFHSLPLSAWWLGRNGQFPGRRWMCIISWYSALLGPLLSFSFSFIDTHTISPKKERDGMREERLKHNWHPCGVFLSHRGAALIVHPHLICMTGLS